MTGGDWEVDDRGRPYWVEHEPEETDDNEDEVAE